MLWCQLITIYTDVDVRVMFTSEDKYDIYPCMLKFSYEGFTLWCLFPLRQNNRTKKNEQKHPLRFSMQRSLYAF